MKVVAQALPIYTMNCFLLPKTLCDELNSIIARFWRSGDGEKRKIHWLSWNKLCQPKRVGGLGFRDLGAFNYALLAKQAWNLLMKADSLVARLF